MKFTVETCCQTKPKRTTKIQCTYEGVFEFDEHDLSSWHAECDLCGDHGGIAVWLKCPSCGGSFELEIKEH